MYGGGGEILEYKIILIDKINVCKICLKIMNIDLFSFHLFRRRLLSKNRD